MRAVSKSLAQVRPVESEHPNGEFELILSDGSADRDGEQLKAADWETPLPNKIHLDSDHAWANGMSVPLTVGSGRPSFDSHGRIVVRGVYAGTAHGQLVRQLVNEGHLWQASVSYLEHKQPNGRVTRELLNGTFCGVPSNPNAVVISSKSFEGGKMLNQAQIDAGFKALDASAQAALADLNAGRINQTKFDAIMDKAEQESAKLKAAKENRSRAMQYASLASPAEHGITGDPRQAAVFTQPARPKSAPKRNELALLPTHLSQEQWRAMHKAVEARAYGFTVAVADSPFGQQQIARMKARLESGGDKMMSVSDNVGLKATPSYSPLEGSPGSLLEPILLPDAFELRYEPDRVWSHFPGAEMTSQSQAYLRHTSNLAAAGITPEGQQIPDVQMQVAQFTATAVKVDGICSLTRELVDDYDSMSSFAPAELSRAVIDRETNYVINDPTAGLLATPGILTRNANNSVNGIDAVEAAKDDIRVATGAFGMADLVILHPTTWLSMRLTRATTGQYLLRQNEPMDYLGQQQADSFFGTKVVTNTYCPQSTAIVMDSAIAVKAFTRMGMEVMFNQFGDEEFTTFGVRYRAVERIALAVIRPAAICVVSGLLSNPAGGS
ncbi:phage major capsid protein [Mycobacterium sp. 852002-50816_SCH5313054-b]|uniref:phage major capsid protein n=1 Tax=Mycobacterium sp. 852002-50816_SCH5313054-b TaxID=1834092 RepID=UPI000A86636A|nr:phage major capsid protein [Mycobacterium sp. 852002-50816_SCH5313054-b]